MMKLFENLPTTLASVAVVVGLAGHVVVLAAPLARAETVVTDPATDDPAAVTDDTPSDDTSTAPTDDTPQDDPATDDPVDDGSIHVIGLPVIDGPIDLPVDVEYFSMGSGGPITQRGEVDPTLAGHGRDPSDVCTVSAHAAQTKFCH